MIVKNRERKIKAINDLLNGKNIILAENRPEIKFNRIRANLYKDAVSSKLYTIEEIQALNMPYREINTELKDWQEIREYEAREETYFGLPFLVQIQKKNKNHKLPNQIILPALTID